MTTFDKKQQCVGKSNTKHCVRDSVGVVTQKSNVRITKLLYLFTPCGAKVLYVITVTCYPQHCTSTGEKINTIQRIQFE